MIDIKLFQNNFGSIENSYKKRGIDTKLLNELKIKLENIKTLKQNLEKQNSNMNKVAKQIGDIKRAQTYNKPIENGLNIEDVTKQTKNIKNNIITLKDELSQKEIILNNILLTLPNLLSDDTPNGINESDNIVFECVGKIPTFNFIPKPHYEIGENKGLIDFKRGVKIAKSRFSAYSGDGAKIMQALIRYFLKHNEKYGFKNWHIPFLVNENALLGTGQLPKFKDDLFKIEDENLYLVPTAEVALTNLYNDEIIKQENLPILMSAYSPCFRKEAGSAGIDTRGILRQHQFDKVEMVAITSKEQSDEVFDSMVKCASNLLDKLGLAYRKVLLCSGDIGFSASKTVDLEVWFPSQKCYREISSISNTIDFQARRAKIRYKSKDGKNQLCHTLNGSSLAVGRTFAAIIENFQNKDGSINTPKVLQEYL
jgi:seryl-tRNA synthetase